MGCLHSLISTLDFVSDVGFREPQDPELCHNIRTAFVLESVGSVLFIPFPLF